MKRKLVAWYCTVVYNIIVDRLASCLLLQAGISCNVGGGRVDFITNKPWQQLPKLVHGMPKPDPVLMQRLQMLYVTTALLYSICKNHEVVITVMSVCERMRE